MPREIKTTLMVDGEAAFKRSINEAQTSMKNLGTQLTLAQANFKKDGDAMKLMETRSKALNAEIGQQNEIVKALEKAVEDSSKAYGENSAKTEKWQAELNRAQAKLVSLQNELTLNEAGLDRSGRAFDENADKVADYNATLQQVGKGINFEVLSSGVHGITGTIESAITKIIELGQKLTEIMREAAAWADDLITESIRNGLTVEQQQQYEYAAKFADTSVDTIMSARDKLVKKMVSGWKDGDIDMWEFLGIDASTTRDPMDVLFELGETLQGVAWADKSDVRADAWAQEVFGRGYRDLLPLFSFGRENWYQKMAEAPLVSDEDVEKLGNLNDQFDEFDSRLQALKETALAQLAPAVEGIVQNINGLLEHFSAWMETDEGKEAMSELSAAIEELFSGLGDLDFADVINTVKEALTSVKDALVWLAEHKQDVYDALKIIAGGFALLKLSDLALNIGKIVTGLGGLFGGGKGGSPGGGGTGETGGGGFWTTAAAFVLKKVLPVAAGVGTVVADSLNNHASNDETTDTFLTNALNGDEYARGITDKLRERYGVTIDDLRNGLLAQVMSKGWTSDEELFSRLENEHGWQAIPEEDRNKTGLELLRDVGKEMTEAQAASVEKWWDAWRKDQWSDEADSAWDSMERAFSENQELWDKFNEAFENAETEDEDYSWLNNEDLLRDIGSQGEDLSTSAASLDDATASMRSVMDGAKAVTDKVAGVDLKTFNGLPPQITAAVQNGAAAGVSGIRVQMDGYTVGRLVAPYVSSILAATVGR